MLTSIKAKLLLSHVGLIVLVSAAIGIFSYFLMLRSLGESQRSNLEVIASFQSKHLQETLERRSRVFEYAADAQKLKKFLLAYQEPMLVGWFGEFSAEFPTLAFVNSLGQEVLKLDQGKISDRLEDVSRNPVFQDARKTPNRVIASFSGYRSERLGPCATFALWRQDFFDEFEGCLFGRARIADMVKDLQEFTFGETGFIALLDRDGTLLSHPLKEAVFHRATFSGEASERIISEVEEMKAGFGRAVIQGTDGFVAYRPVPGTPWILMATLPYEEYMAPLYSLGKNGTLFSCLILTMGILLALALASHISRPIRRLTAAAGLIAEGDLTQRVPVRLHDEIGNLGKAFNRMADDLEKSRDELEQRVEERTAELSRTVLSLNREMAERREVEDALHRSREITRALLNASPDIAMMQDPDGTVVAANEAFLRTLGLKGEDIAGRRVFDFLPASTADTRRSQCAEVIRTRKPLRFEEESLGRHYDYTIFPLLDREGEVTRLAVFAHDMTERITVEKRLRQVQKLEAIGTLAGGIAHDFNNLLMVIQGSVSLILSDMDADHPDCTLLENVQQQVKAGARLTGQLLGYAGKGRYDVRVLDPNVILEETCDTFSRARREITIHKDLSDDLPGFRGDRDQISQALMNLYVNAAEAMPSGGDLFLWTGKVTQEDMKGRPDHPEPGTYLKMKIRDTGAGMDKATMERVFDPFFTTKGMGRGTGLGLAVTYGIIKGHGGYIDVSSEEGRGTTFSIYLPASEPRSEMAPAGTSKPLTGQGTVLLVDDERMVLDLSSRILERLGHSVLKTESPTEALKMFEENRDRIDLVILDMIMPEMGGGEVFDRLRAISPGVKVLLCSGYSLDGPAREIMDRGCDGFIQKPFTMHELSGSIRKILNKP